MDKKRVLFLCTGNSARSQMAEAITNAHLVEAWEAFSAGSHPSGYVHPMALQVLAEIGIRHEGRSKPVEEFTGESFDLVITLCDAAADDCPLWLGKGKQVHVPYPDPAKEVGTEAEKLTAFRAVRDVIIKDIVGLLVNS